MSYLSNPWAFMMPNQLSMAPSLNMILGDPTIRGILYQLMQGGYNFGPPQAVSGTPGLPGTGTGAGASGQGGNSQNPGGPGTVGSPDAGQIGGPPGPAPVSSVPLPPAVNPAANPTETIMQYLMGQYPGSSGWSPYGVTVGNKSRVFTPGSVAPMGYMGQYNGQTIYVSPPSGSGFTQAPGQALPDLSSSVPVPKPYQPVDTGREN